MIPSHVRRASSIALGLIASLAVIGATLAAGDVRLTNDVGGGYISAYTLATGNAYTDADAHRMRRRSRVARTSRRSRSTRATRTCSSAAPTTTAASTTTAWTPTAPRRRRADLAGLLPLRERRRAASRARSSRATRATPRRTRRRAQIRTASAGDPVIAWDGHGRVFMGSESSDDPAGTMKTFGDVWVGDLRQPRRRRRRDASTTASSSCGREIVAKGSSAPNLLGKFNDKTAIEADRTGGVVRRQRLLRLVALHRQRRPATSTSPARPTTARRGRSRRSLTPSIHDVQFPDIAVTGNGHVYVTFRQFAAQSGQADAVDIVKSTDCGATFGQPRCSSFLRYDASDVSARGRAAGVDRRALRRGGTERRRRPRLRRLRRRLRSPATRSSGATPRSARPPTRRRRARVGVHRLRRRASRAREVADRARPTGRSSAGRRQPVGRLLPRAGRRDRATRPRRCSIDDQPTGHQLFPDIAVDGGHAPRDLVGQPQRPRRYSPARARSATTRPATPSVARRLRARPRPTTGAHWTGRDAAHRHDDQPQLRAVRQPHRAVRRRLPVGHVVGGSTFGVWTDWRDTVAGRDPRETPADERRRAPTSSSAAPSTLDRRWSRRHLPARGRPRPKTYFDPSGQRSSVIFLSPRKVTITEELSTE